MTDNLGFSVKVLLDRNSQGTFVPVLTEQECAAIGLVTAQWAFLEHLLLLHHVDLVTAANAEIPTDAFNLSFEKRLRAWRLSVEQYTQNDKEKERLLAIHSKISNAEDRRHKVTHGLWEWDRANPEKLTAHSFRPRVEFERKFDRASIIKLAMDIGSISFSIQYPGGAAQFYELASENAPDSYVDRSWLLSLMEKGPPDQGPGQATPPKRTLPQ